MIINNFGMHLLNKNVQLNGQDNLNKNHIVYIKLKIFNSLSKFMMYKKLKNKEN